MLGVADAALALRAGVLTGAAALSAGLSAGLPLSSFAPRLNRRPKPPATAPAVAAAAVVAIEGLPDASGAASALAGAGVVSAGLRPGIILPKRPAMPPAGAGAAGFAAGAAAACRSTGTNSGPPKLPISFLPPMVMAIGRSARTGSPAGKAAASAAAGKVATGAAGSAGTDSFATVTAGADAAWAVSCSSEAAAAACRCWARRWRASRKPRTLLMTIIASSAAPISNVNIEPIIKISKIMKNPPASVTLDTKK